MSPRGINRPRRGRGPEPAKAGRAAKPAAGAGERLALAAFTLEAHTLPGQAVRRRYYAEAVIPFLDGVSSNPRLRVSIGATGADLVFFAREFPSPFRALRRLIELDQVELISSLFAASPWWAFPLAELLRSESLNRLALAELGLRPSRVFMAPRGHFGPMIGALVDRFDAAICSGDQLQLVSERRITEPFYHVGGIPLIVAFDRLATSGEPQDRSCADLVPQPAAGAGAARATPLYCEARRAAGPATYEGDVPPQQWIHCCEIHQVSSPHPPTAWDAFFLDSSRVAERLNKISLLQESGYRLVSAATIASTLRKRPPSSALPVLIDTGPNVPQLDPHPVRNSNWVPLLSLAQRAQETLTACEKRLGSMAPARRRRLESRLTSAWRQQQLSAAGSARALAGGPRPDMLREWRESADSALDAATDLSLALGLRASDRIDSAASRLPPALRPVQHPPIECQAFGAESSSQWFETPESSVFVGRILLTVAEDDCGVRFKRRRLLLPVAGGGGALVLRDLEDASFYPDDLVLPLADSLIGIDQDLFVIRVNRYWPGPAFASKGSPWLWFVAEGYPEGRLFDWRFLVVKGKPLESAAALASSVNHV